MSYNPYAQGPSAESGYAYGQPVRIMTTTAGDVNASDTRNFGGLRSMPAFVFAGDGHCARSDLTIETPRLLTRGIPGAA